MKSLRPSIALLLLSLLTAALAPVPVQAQTVVEERWYVMLVEGKPSGWVREAQERSADGKLITTHSQNKMSLKRGALTIVIESASEFVETAEGKPVRAVSTTTTGATKVVQTATFGDKAIEIVTEHGGQITRSSQPLPKQAWLPPAAAGRYVSEQFKKKAKEIEVVTMEPASDLKPLTIGMTVLETEDIEVMGKVVPATKVAMTLSNLPGIVSAQHVDDQGRMLKMTLTPMPGFSITVLLADKDLAMAQVDPPEVLAATLIEMKVPIKNPRKLKTAVYELTFKPAAGEKQDKKGLPEIPKSAHQRVVWSDDQTARVIIDLTRPQAPGDDLPTKEHRTANAVLNSDDPKIKELVAAALKGKPDTMTDTDKAQVLRAYVYRYIRKKDLSVGFAYASEVARTRQGDCTEHAVLLAAMLRAAEIPSRTVSGLIYIDEFQGKKNVFGYHMWAQAWVTDAKIGGHWIDVDATLGDPGYDAAHITLGVSAMTDGAINNDMMHMVPLIGRLEIKVIQTKE